MSYRVFLGIGHGGSDPGAVKYVKESWANLVIGLEVKRLLEAAGIVVGISRVREENDDINEEIREANAFAPDLAFEIHNNAGGGNGFEVFVQTNVYAAKSKACAEAVEAEVKAIGQQSRGIKTNSFGWTRLVNAPAVLTEGFFVDNASDAADFDTEAELHNLAAAYARGILKYFGVDTNKTGNPHSVTVAAKFGLAGNTVDYLEAYNSGSILRKLAGNGASVTAREIVQTVYNLSDAEMKHMDKWPWATELYKKIAGRD